MKKAILSIALLDLIFITAFNGVFEAWQSYASDAVLFVLFLVALFVTLKEDRLNAYSVSTEVILFTLIVLLLPLFSYYRFVSLHTAYDILAALAAFFIFANLANRSNEKFALYGIIFVGLFAAISGYAFYLAVAVFPHSHIATYAVGHSFISGTRIASFFQYPNTFGGFLLLPFFIALGLSARTQKRAERVFLILSAAFLMSILYFTQSRGAEIAFILALIGFIIYAGKRKDIWANILLIGIFATAFILLNSRFFSNAIQQNAARAKVLVSFFAGEQNRSLYDRIVLAKDAVNVFVHHPLFGTGFGTFRYAITKYRFNLFYARFPHSILFRFIAETGIAGTLAFLYAIIVLLVKAFKVVKTDIAKLAVFFGTLGILLHMLLDLDFAFPIMQILLFAGIALCLCEKPLHLRISVEKKHLALVSLSLLVVFAIFISIIPRTAAIAFSNGADAALKAGNLKKAINGYTIAAKLEKGSADFYDSIGYAYEKLAYEKTDCTPYLAKAVNAYKKAESLNTLNFAYPYYTSNVLLLEKDGNAVTYGEKSFENNPLWKPILSEVALAYAYTEENCTKAETDAEEALNFKAPRDAYKAMHFANSKVKDSTALTALGFCKLKDDTTDAEALFKKAITLNPNNGFAYLGLSDCYEKNGDTARMCENLYRALHANACIKEVKEKYFSTVPLIAPKTVLSKEVLKPGSTVTIRYEVKNNAQVAKKLKVIIETSSSEVSVAMSTNLNGTISFVMPDVNSPFRIALVCIDKNGVEVSKTLSPLFNP